MTKLSRATDHYPLEIETIVRSSVAQLEDCVEEGKLMKRPVRQDSPQKTSAVNYHVDRSSWSVREVEWYTAEDRLLLSAKDSDDACRWVSELGALINLN